jgi:hypothetical protein
MKNYYPHKLLLLTNKEFIKLRKNYDINEEHLKNDLDTEDFEPIVKYFNPIGIGTWYLSELSPDNIGFGICHLFEIELGYVCLKELKSLKLRWDLKIEKDLYFSTGGLKLSELYDQLKQSERQ